MMPQIVPGEVFDAGELQRRVEAVLDVWSAKIPSGLESGPVW
jgi:hypothetical protein